MSNWLKRLFGSEQAAAIKPAQVSAAPAPTPARAAEPAPPAPSPADPQAANATPELDPADLGLQWVFSLHGHGASHDGPHRSLTLGTLADAVERMSLDTTRAADWVPRVPTVLPGLLRSLRNENTSAQDLAQQIEQDVSLVAEALKVANSAQHQRATAVTTTEEAVRLLGSQGLRLLIARVAFRPVLGADAGPMTRMGAPRVWALGEACAQASRDLAPGRGLDPFEAFLSGLALNVGLMVALRMADRVSHLSRPDAHGLGPRSVPVGEGTQGLGLAHASFALEQAAARLSHRVAARWELPEDVVGTITAQVDRLAQTRWPQAADLLAVAQQAAWLRVLDDAKALPKPLAECAAHLPADAQEWLLKPTQTSADD